MGGGQSESGRKFRARPGQVGANAGGEWLARRARISWQDADVTKERGGVKPPVQPKKGRPQVQNS